VRTGKKLQISPLRFAPVEMTILFGSWNIRFQEKVVVSTGATCPGVPWERSGEICSFLPVLTHTVEPVPFSCR
jgi:hypothetical protein